MAARSTRKRLVHYNNKVPMKSFVSALILSAVSAVANHFFRFYAKQD